MIPMTVVYREFDVTSEIHLSRYSSYLCSSTLLYCRSAHVRSAKVDDDHTDGAPSNEEDMEE